MTEADFCRDWVLTMQDSRKLFGTYYARECPKCQRRSVNMHTDRQGGIRNSCLWLDCLFTWYGSGPEPAIAKEH